MYKNIKVFRKSENLQSKFSHPSIEEKLENVRLIPLGIDEVIEYSSSFPILISSNKENEFVLYRGLMSDKNLFTMCSNIQEPLFLRNYPFLMIDIQDENKKDISVIAYDENIKSKNTINFFEKEILSKQADEKINNVRLLQTKRNLAKIIIQELKQKELLIKQSFNIKIDNETKTILKDYYIVNRTKLTKLDDKTLSLWAKNGWMGFIDAHLYSLRNFQKIVDIIK